MENQPFRKPAEMKKEPTEQVCCRPKAASLELLKKNLPKGTTLPALCAQILDDYASWLRSQK